MTATFHRRLSDARGAPPLVLLLGVLLLGVVVALTTTLTMASMVIIGVMMLICLAPLLATMLKTFIRPAMACGPTMSIGATYSSNNLRRSPRRLLDLVRVHRRFGETRAG